MARRTCHLGPGHSAKHIVKNVEQAIEHWALENRGPCPARLADLVPSQIKRVPRDAWGEPLHYVCPSRHGDSAADIVSKGPDKQLGTKDDINSWEL
ncbi:MAG: type II secretion system protein GspG [Myxococcales bacterium]|nr:type II secretion system protein GspG [Myxococcales bacterium]